MKLESCGDATVKSSQLLEFHCTHEATYVVDCESKEKRSIEFFQTATFALNV